MGGCNLLSITSGMSVGYMLADPDLDIQLREINLRISRRIRMRRLHSNCYLNISPDERPVPVDCLTSNGTPSSSHGVTNAGHAADLWIHWRKVVEEKPWQMSPCLPVLCGSPRTGWMPMLSIPSAPVAITWARYGEGSM